MVFLIYLILIFWFIRTAKAILFWLYLWQLKEYHLGRFLAHFSTEKGKKLLFNKIIFVKFLLVFILLSSFISGFFENVPEFLTKSSFLLLYISIIFTTLFFLYAGESLKALKDFFGKKLKTPILTKKTLCLIIAGISIEILFLFILYQGMIYIYQMNGIYVYPKVITGDSFYPLGLLVFDILTPLIVSVIVFVFQPLAILGKWRIIQKAKKKREKFKNLLVIGITGSYGKTSTKEILYTILSEKFNVLKTKEHQNSEIGVSQCILDDLRPEHQIFICEMGAYNRGGIKLLCDIVKPKIGILTGINEQHMATFGTQENIIKTKYELIESLPADGVAFFNAKNKYCLELFQKTKIKKFLYGKETDSADSENIAGAVEVAKELGMSEEEIAYTKKKIKPCLQIEKGINNLNIINSTYSANPNSVIAHLDYLKTWSGKKVIIMPCLIELGKASKEVHQRIGKKIAEVCDLAIITTKECFEDIKIEARSGFCKTLFLEDPRKIFEKIKDFNHSDDIILLEGRLSKEILSFLI